MRTSAETPARTSRRPRRGAGRDAETQEPKNKRVEQGEATRARLVEVATELFAANGFAGTSTEDLVRKADVTRGALYHHFRDKEELFEAAFEAVEARIVREVVKGAASAGDSLAQLRQGLRTFLDVSKDRAVERIVLLEGPSVLGAEKWHEIDERYAHGLIVASLSAAMDDGLLERQPVDPLAHLLLGAMTQAAIVVARDKESASATRSAMAAALDRLVDGLRPGGRRARRPVSRSR